MALDAAVHGREAGATIATLLLFIAISSATASTPAPIIHLDQEFESIVIVRCHFAEGRVVVRCDDRLHVLHEGDRLETTGLKVVEIAADSAIFAIRGSGPTGHLRIVRVTNPATGVIKLREFSTDPAALTTGKSAAGAPMAAQKTRPPDPPSAD